MHYSSQYSQEDSAVRMAGKKGKQQMPTTIPNLLLISGDIINPVKLLMDTAGQIVGKQTQDEAENTRKEDQKEKPRQKHDKRRPKAKVDESIHSCKEVRMKKKKKDKDMRSKSECRQTQMKESSHKKSDNAVSHMENTEEYKQKNMTRNCTKDSHKEVIKAHSKKRNVRRRSDTPSYLQEEDWNTFELMNLEKCVSNGRVDKIKNVSYLPERGHLKPALSEILLLKKLSNDTTEDDTGDGDAVSYADARYQRRRLSVPALIFDQSATSNLVTRSLNRMAIGKKTFNSISCLAQPTSAQLVRYLTVSKAYFYVPFYLLFLILKILQIDNLYKKKKIPLLHSTTCIKI